MYNNFEKYNIVLASQSPRRIELLSLITPNFSVVPANIDEPSVSAAPAEAVRRISLLKAQKVASLVSSGSLVIGADTLVYAENAVMGKPKNEEEAFEMIKILSGKTHNVYTGVTVINTLTNKAFTESECTGVSFAEMSESEIRDYIATGEPMDKAGAYGIQGYASRFITGISGCYFNVVGLPVRLTYRLLNAAAASD